MSRWTLSFLLGLALVGCKNTETDTDSVVDTDGDTDSPASDQPDTDDDSIIDVHEGDDDPDGDGKPNSDDKDSDGDTIRDAVEAGDLDPMTLPVDSDGDGVYDYLDLDSDNNCTGDDVEAGRDDGGAVDTDGDGVRDYADLDNDGDGILDEDEIGGADICDPVDTDDDSIPDFMDVDSDGDGIGDKWEGGATDFESEPSDSDHDGTPDFQDSDSDNDGTPDGEESGVETVDEKPTDTDGDGLYDFQDEDADGDSLTDAEELEIGTDPYDFDTDDDTYSDGGEVLAETDPLDSESVIDGVYVEVGERTETEQEFIFELRIERGDIAMLSDTTCSMSSSLTAAKSVFTTILTEAQATFDDIAGASGGFDDYPYGGFGSVGSDKPFYVNVPVTSDFAEVQAGVDKLTIHSGNDGPESGYEAYYQSASGAGYDQDCDGNYDPTLDVVPFLADPADPFGGTGGEWYDPSLPDAGTRGGFGFREYSIPVVVLVQDNYMRDPESANSMYNGSPGGCPIDAGHSDTVAAFLDLGGYPITIDTAGLGTPQSQQLAFDTKAYADMNGDGTVDPTDTEDLLQQVLNQSSSTYAADLADYVVLAVDQLVAAIKFSEVTLEVEGDEYGFVIDVQPEKYSDIDPDAASDLTFTITFRGTVAATVEDQIFLLTLNIIGDGTTLVGSKDIVVVVPGTNG